MADQNGRLGIHIEHAMRSPHGRGVFTVVSICGVEFFKVSLRNPSPFFKFATGRGAYNHTVYSEVKKVMKMQRDASIVKVGAATNAEMKTVYKAKKLKTNVKKGADLVTADTDEVLVDVMMPAVVDDAMTVLADPVAGKMPFDVSPKDLFVQMTDECVAWMYHTCRYALSQRASDRADARDSAGREEDVAGGVPAAVGRDGSDADDDGDSEDSDVGDGGGDE